MDASLTSDGDSDLEDTECQALVGESRRSDGGCCCGVCCKVCLLFTLCLLVVGTVFRQELTTHLAGIGIAAAQIQFESVDVGTIRNTQTLDPHIIASVRCPSPVNADVRMTRLVLKVPTFPTRALARVGTVTMPALRVKAFQDLLLNATAHVEIEDLGVFGLAGKHAVREPDSAWVVEGQLQVSCDLGLFTMEIGDIPFKREVALKGMAGFAQDANPVTMQAITKAYGYSDHLDTTVTINIYNPSYLSARLDTPTQFNITQRGHSFGTALVQEVALIPGQNTVAVRFLLHDDISNREAVRAFILGYIRADVQMVSMHGSERSCSDPLLAVVLSGLKLTFRFKPPPASFIHHITANVGIIGLQVTAQVSNPLPQEIVIGATDLSVRENTVKGEKIFRLKGNRTSGLGGQILQPSAISELHLSLSTLDADLKDPLLIARLIEDAVDGAVVVPAAEDT